jgi:hypothetical protein
LRNNEGHTGLIIASAAGHDDIVALLLKKYADINMQGNNGKNALMVSIFNFKYDVTLSLLLHDNIDLNLKDINGNTALHLACIATNIRAAYLLSTQKKIDYSVKNNKGQTAYEECNDGEIKWLLDQHIKMQNKTQKDNFVEKFRMDNERALLKKHIRTNNINTFIKTVHFKAITSTKKKDLTVCEVKGSSGLYSFGPSSTYQIWNNDLMCWDSHSILPDDFKARIECDDNKILHHTSAADSTFHIKFDNLCKPDGTLMTNLYE